MPLAGGREGGREREREGGREGGRGREEGREDTCVCMHTYMHECIYVCVCARARAERVCVCVCVCACVCVCVCACDRMSRMHLMLACARQKKENYLAYYNAAMQLVRAGGAICFDDTLWSGRVVEDSGARSVANVLLMCC